MKKIYTILLTLLVIITVTSCKKKKIEPEFKSDKWTYVKNLYIGDEILSKVVYYEGSMSHFADENDPAAYWYFNLDEGKVIPYKEAKGNNWDFCIFPETYKINVNNKKSGARRPTSDFFKQMQGETMMTLLPGSFDKVLSAPVDEEFNKRRDSQGKVMERENYQWLNDMELADGGFGDGWWRTASFGGDLFIALHKPSNHTFVIKTNKGNYAKLQFTSFYKDSPSAPDKNSKKHYLSFHYVIQKDGSRNLDIK